MDLLLNSENKHLLSHTQKRSECLLKNNEPSTQLPTYRTEKPLALLRMSRNETFDPLSWTDCSFRQVAIWQFAIASEVSPTTFWRQNRMIAARVARTLARNIPKSLLKVGNISSFSSYLTESKGSLLSKSRNFRARAKLKHFNLTCKTGIRPTLDQFLGEFPISYFAHSVSRENSLLLQLQTILPSYQLHPSALKNILHQKFKNQLQNSNSNSESSLQRKLLQNIL